MVEEGWGVMYVSFTRSIISTFPFIWIKVW
jgi:hypothetical protein